MKVISDDIIFDAIISRAAKENIDILTDYGKNDPFTETEKFGQMMDKVYSSISKAKKAEKPKRKAWRKAAIIAAVIVALLMAAAFSASAVRIFLYKTWTDIQGDIMNVNIDSTNMSDEYFGISNFEKPDKILIPTWLPKGTDLIRIYDTGSILELRYRYQDHNINLSQQILSSNMVSMNNQIFLERSEYESSEIEINGLTVNILKIKGDTGRVMCMAQWLDNEASYTLATDGSELLLKSILSSIKPLY